MVLLSGEVETNRGKPCPCRSGAFRMVLLSGEVETKWSGGFRSTAATRFRMVLLSGEVETSAPSTGCGTQPDRFRMALLSGEVETRWLVCIQSIPWWLFLAYSVLSLR